MDGICLRLFSMYYFLNLGLLGKKSNLQKAFGGCYFMNFIQHKHNILSHSISQTEWSPVTTGMRT